MAPVQGLSPKIQDANSEVAIARPKMNTRLKNSEKVVIASQYLDLNVPFFEKHGHDILKLIEDTNTLSKAIDTLNDAGYEAGPCKITKKGFFWNTQIKKPVEEVNDDIQNNLDQEVVKTALTTLGISKEPEASSLTFSSNRTLVKGGVAVAVTTAIGGSGYYFRDKIAANIPAVPQGMKDAFNAAYSKIPSLPSTKPVTDFFATQWTNVSNSQAGVFVANNKLAVGAGVGAIVTLVAAYAIYKVIQNRKSQEEA